jgi:hypothetical protein
MIARRQEKPREDMHNQKEIREENDKKRRVKNVKKGE